MIGAQVPQIAVISQRFRVEQVVVETRLVRQRHHGIEEEFDGWADLRLRDAVAGEGLAADRTIGQGCGGKRIENRTRLL